MNQRKTMKLWQMIVLLILLVGLLVTMFLPAYHINGNAFLKLYRLVESVQGEKEEDDAEEVQKKVEELDKKIKEVEKVTGIKFLSIAPGNIMIHSMNSYITEEKLDQLEDLNGISTYGSLLGSGYSVEFITKGISGIKSLHTMQRIIFWSIYLLAIVVIVLLILGFCLKWTKYISLIISAVYGLAGAVIFGLLQFWLPRMFAKKILEAGGSLGIMELTSPVVGKMFSCFWGIAFLIGFIIAILFVIMSVVSMFVGGYSAATVEEGNTPIPVVDIAEPDPWQLERERQERECQERERQERERQEQERKERERQQREREERERQKQAATPPMGLVRCTRGVAAGQGFSLPEDRKVVVGKSNQNANLIISYPHVSNVHCSIRYKTATNSYIVKDHSSNGTFVNGVRLQKDVPMEFPAGTVLQLADGSNEITLG